MEVNHAANLEERNNEKQELCFDRSSLMSEQFSIDNFVKHYGELVGLEKLRDDLGLHLKHLRSLLISVIHKDYDDFLKLSSSLDDFQDKIPNVLSTLTEMKDELTVLKEYLNDNLLKANNLMNMKNEIQIEKRHLKCVEKLQLLLPRLNELLTKNNKIDKDNDDYVIMLERAVNEINTCEFLLGRCRNENIQHYNENLKNMKNILISEMKDALLNKGYKNQNENIVNCCLKLYKSLNEIQTVYDVIEMDILIPIMDSMINENSLQDQPIGLQGLYMKIIKFIDTNIMIFVKNEKECTGSCNLMVMIVWPEICKRLLNLKCIFAPGNPDKFHERFRETMEFLDNFEDRCLYDECVLRIRKLKCTQNFTHSWNLSVYFQIRFQEIGGTMESTMESENYEKYNDDWEFSTTSETWKCLNLCWSDLIFIRQLAHRFWKFNLQILSRYTTWIRFTINQNVSQMPEDRKLDIFVRLYMDSDKLSRKLPELMNVAERQISINISESVKNNLHESFEKCKTRLFESVNESEKYITDKMAEETFGTIKQCNDIPRLYRRTNREIPTEPSHYVSNIFKPIFKFNQKYETYAHKWVHQILSQVTLRFHDELSEVINSIQKTEDSLRKFKKIRDQAKSEKMENTDNDKIRLQLRIDIETFINKANELTAMENIVTLPKLQILQNSLN